MIRNAHVFYEDETFTYENICAKNEYGCFENNLLYLNESMKDVRFKQNHLSSYYSIHFNLIYKLLTHSLFADWIWKLQFDFSIYIYSEQSRNRSTTSLLWWYRCESYQFGRNYCRKCTMLAISIFYRRWYRTSNRKVSFVIFHFFSVIKIELQTKLIFYNE